MNDWHPDTKTLEIFLDDELPENLTRSLQSHLFTCSACETRLLDILPDPAGLSPVGSGARGADGYEYLVRHVLRQAQQRGGRRALLARERLESVSLWSELNDLDPAARRNRIWDDPAFQTWGFFELLVEKARLAVPDEPRRAEEMLRLALDVADHLSPETYGPGAIGAARTRAWAGLGNALRVLADFRQSEQAFRHAEAHYETSWLDPMDEAQIREYKSSLRRAQRRFDEARELLDAAIAIYREVNEPHCQGRAMLAKALLLRYEGEKTDAAAALLRDSLFLIDGREEPRLLAVSQSNLIGCLIDTGRLREASGLLPEALKLVERVGVRADSLRLRWMQATIAATLGRPGEAEQIFLELIDAFTEERLAYDVALASLELSSLYSRQGRPADVKRLAAEMLPIFQSCEVPREALAALIVFQKAAEMEQASVGLVEEVASFLQRIQSNPGLRFRESPGSSS